MQGGLSPSGGGAYSALTYGLTWFHAIHVAIGALALSWLAYKGYRGGYTPARHLSLRLWSMYWHFVGVVWLIMFTLLFVI